MKKLIKKGKSVFDLKVTLTEDERLNKLNIQSVAPKKLAEANKHLKKIKTLPK